MSRSHVIEDVVTFDLIDQPWIPVMGEDGFELVSLRLALLEAETFTGLAPRSVTQAPAVLRQVLLPVVLDAVGPPRSEAEWYQMLDRGRFSDEQRERIVEYLDEHRCRFDLFHPELPFAQVGGLRTPKGETKPVSLLIPSAASGNNVPLFSVRTEADVLRLAPADAALWLLHAHCWDTAAIKTGADGDPVAKAGKTTGNPTGPLGQLGMIVPIGRTLFDTILFNLPIRSDGADADDLPQWRRPPMKPVWEPRRACGLLDLLTWQSRRIKLFPDITTEGEPVVARVIVAAGDRLVETPEYEPHTVWRVEPKPKAGQPSSRPRRHMPGRAAWRGLDALLALSRPSDGAGLVTSVLLRQLGELRVEGWLADDYPLRVDTCGIQYGNQSAVVEEVITDSLPLPVAALTKAEAIRDLVLEIVKQAEELADAMNHLSADLRRASGGEPTPWDKGQRPGDLLIHSLDALVRRVLAGIQGCATDDDARLNEGQRAWEVSAARAATRVAEQLLAAAPPTAFAGREVDGKTYRQATAEQNFRRQLRKILPLATDDRGPEGRDR